MKQIFFSMFSVFLIAAFVCACASKKIDNWAPNQAKINLTPENKMKGDERLPSSEDDMNFRLYQDIRRQAMIRERIQIQIRLLIVRFLIMENSQENQNDAKKANVVMNHIRKIWKAIADDAHNTAGERKHQLGNRVRRLVFQDLFKDVQNRIGDYLNSPNITANIKVAAANFQETLTILDKITIEDPIEFSRLTKNVEQDIGNMNQEDRNLMQANSLWIKTAMQSLKLKEDADHADFLRKIRSSHN